jgi:hypothetical protein
MLTGEARAIGLARCDHFAHGPPEVAEADRVRKRLVSLGQPRNAGSTEK